MVDVDEAIAELRAMSAAEKKAQAVVFRSLKVELRHKIKAAQLGMQAIRANYTNSVRSRGSMMRGGGFFGRLVRTVQTVSRDNSRSNLASELRPLEVGVHELKTRLILVERLLTICNE